MYINSLLGATALGLLVLVQSCGGKGVVGRPLPTTPMPQNLQFVVPGARVVSFQVDFVTTIYRNPCVHWSGPLVSTNDGTENIAQCTVLVPASGQIFYDASITIAGTVQPGSAMHVRSCNAC